MSIKASLTKLAERAARDARVSLSKAQARLVPEELRKVLRTLTSAPTISWSDVRRRMLACPGIQTLTLSPSNDALQLSFEDEFGREHAVQLRVANIYFAARGAKEIHFSVEPAGLARNSALRECVGAMAELIARKIWPFAVEQKRVGLATLAEADGSTIRVDLREVPAVQAFLRRPDLGMLADVIVPSAIRFVENGVEISLALPVMPKT